MTVRAGPSEYNCTKIMVAMEMPLEFVSHPVMKQVSDDTMSRQFRDMMSVIVNAIELRLLLASVPVRLTMVMADSLCNGQRDPTRHGDVFQVHIKVFL